MNTRQAPALISAVLSGCRRIRPSSQNKSQITRSALPGNAYFAIIPSGRLVVVHAA
jgi:hypothetical protein